MKDNETPFYLISLIEHKPDVDYNVVMQAFCLPHGDKNEESSDWDAGACGRRKDNFIGGDAV